MTNYISLFEKFIDIIDWKLLQATSVKYNTDFRAHSFYTNQHLAAIIYFHICEHHGLRHLNQSIHDNLKDSLTSVSTSTFSNHNNNRDYRVFIAVMEKLIYTGLMTDPNTIYICDRGYVDYKKFDSYTVKEIFFISRLKNNAKINHVEDLPITYYEEDLLPKGSVILSTKIVRLGNECVNHTKHNIDLSRSRILLVRF